MKRLFLVLLAMAVAFLALATTFSLVGLGRPSTSAQPQLYSAMPFGPYPRLGVQVAELTPGLAASLGLPFREGVVVLQVLPRTPAETAGLKVRDIIIKVDDAAVAKVSSLLEAIGAKQEVTLTIIREGQELSLTVTLAPPSPQAIPRGGPFLLEELEGIDPQALFFHFQGGEFRILDKEGKAHTVQLTPGLVVEATEGSLTLTPNGQTSNVTYTITAQTRVQEKLEAGDRVVVVTVDSSAEARLVLPGERAFGSMMGWGRPHMPKGWLKPYSPPPAKGWSKGPKAPFSYEKNRGGGLRWPKVGWGSPHPGGR